MADDKEDTSIWKKWYFWLFIAIVVIGLIVLVTRSKKRTQNNINANKNFYTRARASGYMFPGNQE
jgi:hypothetical protein